jgi:signal peptidase I
MQEVASQAISQQKHAAWEPVYRQLLREWIDAGEPVWLPLSGESMAPLLPSGSQVLVSQTVTGQIRFGDLLVYEAEGRIICHRVLRRRRYGASYTFLTKGDGRRMTDPWVYAEQVIGIVVAIDRNGSIVRLNAPLPRLQAVAAAMLSLMVAGSLAALRRTKVFARVHWECRPTS